MFNNLFAGIARRCGAGGILFAYMIIGSVYAQDKLSEKNEHLQIDEIIAVGKQGIVFFNLAITFGAPQGT